MLPQRDNHSHMPADVNSQPSQHSGHRRHHHHRRSFYWAYVRPHREQLRNIFLFVVFVIVAYLIWQSLAT